MVTVVVGLKLSASENLGCRHAAFQPMTSQAAFVHEGHETDIGHASEAA